MFAFPEVVVSGGLGQFVVLAAAMCLGAVALLSRAVGGLLDDLLLGVLALGPLGTGDEPADSTGEKHADKNQDSVHGSDVEVVATVGTVVRHTTVAVPTTNRP